MRQQWKAWSTMVSGIWKRYCLRQSRPNIRWRKGNQVVVLMKSSEGSRYQIKDEHIGMTSGYFSFNSFCMTPHVLLFTPAPSQHERKFETAFLLCSWTGLSGFPTYSDLCCRPYHKPEQETTCPACFVPGIERVLDRAHSRPIERPACVLTNRVMRNRSVGTSFLNYRYRRYRFCSFFDVFFESVGTHFASNTHRRCRFMCLYVNTSLYTDKVH